MIFLKYDHGVIYIYIVVQGGLITSTGVVLVVLVLVFVVPGVVLVIIDVVASHYGY